MLAPYAERAPVNAVIAEEIRRSLTLDPENVDASMAEFFRLDPFGDFLGQHAVIQHLQRIGQNSAEALAMAAFHFGTVGRAREAAASAANGKALDPLSSLANAVHGASLWRSGQIETGRAALHRAAEIWPDDHNIASVYLMACAHAQDWAAVDRLIDPVRLERYPLREAQRTVRWVETLRDPTPEKRQQYFETFARQTRSTGHIDARGLTFLASLDFVDEAFELFDRAKLGPSGGPKDALGNFAYRTPLLFMAAYPQQRADLRFVKLCARLGLVEYWLETQQWPDCADEVPYDFRGAPISPRPVARRAAVPLAASGCGRIRLRCPTSQRSFSFTEAL